MTLLPSSPHIHPHGSVNKIMLAVIYALIPGILVYTVFFGWGILINIILAVITAIAMESAVLKLRQRPILPSLYDGSAIVTALLLALAMPSFAPWWLVFLGTGFAMVVGKHLYGGLGYNPFNPAMVGYAMLLIAFPREMTAWIPPEIHGLGIMDTLRYTFFEILPVGRDYDSITMATPLDTIKTGLNLHNTLGEIRASNSQIFGHLAGLGWEWINFMFLAGGMLLIYMRVITWHIPVAMLGALFIAASLFHLGDSDFYASPVFHLFSGASILGAFFIATDPVTAATTVKGRLYYGAGIGLLIYIIRTWGGYPDAVAFAVLLMNMAVPTIDYYTQPRVFGHKEE